MSPVPAPPQLVHPRQLIREKVAALLKDKTNAGSRVWPSRVRHWNAHKFPAIGVYTPDENSDLADASPRRYDRTVTVLVECLATADEGLDNAIDTLAAQVEAVLLADPTWGGVAGDPSSPGTPTALMGTTTGFDGEGENVTACLIMTWEADYVTRPLDADPTTLDEFRTAHVDWDLAEPEPDADPDAEDTITLEQPEQPEPPTDPQPEE